MIKIYKKSNFNNGSPVKNIYNLDNFAFRVKNLLKFYLLKLYNKKTILICDGLEVLIISVISTTVTVMGLKKFLK